METASGCTKQRLQETEAVMNESRLRSANAKIIIWEHVIEGTEVLLRRTHQLLYRLSSRCDNAATDMEEIETGGQVPEVLAAQELLYELDSTLKFVCDSLSAQEELLEKCRKEELDRLYLHKRETAV